MSSLPRSGCRICRATSAARRDRRQLRVGRKRDRLGVLRVERFAHPPVQLGAIIEEPEQPDASSRAALDAPLMAIV
jgi:hypothetical protein